MIGIFLSAGLSRYNDRIVRHTLEYQILNPHADSNQCVFIFLQKNKKAFVGIDDNGITHLKEVAFEFSKSMNIYLSCSVENKSIIHSFFRIQFVCSG
ncbi:hypothetical protein D0T87_11045 [Bacteroides sp. 51]|nr:hypothetical protein [Bacteroides sp. 51]